jgi:uncharacterized protein (TIGR03067 family)
LRSAARAGVDPHDRHDDIGFRLALTARGSGPVAAQEKREDYQRLQGTWRMTSSEGPLENHKQFDIRFAGEKITYWIDGRFSLAGTLEVLEPAGQKRATWKWSDGRTDRVIYHFAGQDQLVACWTHSGTEWPTAFATGKTGGGSWLFVWQRQPEDYTRFVPIPKGTFWMSKDRKNAQVQVTIPANFELGAYLVTQEQWQSLMGNNPSYFSRQGEGKDKVKTISDDDLKHFPVENMSWNDVESFLRKLNEREKGKGWVYRLPSQAEWEYACRGAATSKEECSFDFYFEKPTNDLSSLQANFKGSKPAGKADVGPDLQRTTKVGSYAPNRLGLHDMHGNVVQWCSDDYGASPNRSARGCTWWGEGRFCRAADLNFLPREQRQKDAGLRLARVPAGSN